MDLKSPSPGFTRSAGCDIMYNDIALSEMKILMLGLGSLEQKRNYPSAGDNAANINVHILGLNLMYLLVENILSRETAHIQIMHRQIPPPPLTYSKGGGDGSRDHNLIIMVSPTS